MIYIYIVHTHRETETETDRQTDRQTDIEREKLCVGWRGKFLSGKESTRTSYIMYVYQNTFSTSESLSPNELYEYPVLAYELIHEHTKYFLR